MPEKLAEYARCAADAFAAAVREPVPAKAALLRQQGHAFVELIRERELELNQVSGDPAS